MIIAHHAELSPSFLVINLSAGLFEFDRLVLHAFLQRFFVRNAKTRGVVAHVLGDFHRAEVRAAHGAEVRALVRVLGHGFVVEVARLVGVEAEVELVLPAEFEARLGERVVAQLRARVALGEVA